MSEVGRCENQTIKMKWGEGDGTWSGWYENEYELMNKHRYAIQYTITLSGVNKLI